MTASKSDTMSERSRILLFSLFVIGLLFPAEYGQAQGYAPGTLRDRKDRETFLTPPSQEEEKAHFWKVQKDVSLYYFTEGQGEEILFLHGGPGFPPLEAGKGFDLLKDDYKVYYYHQRGCGKSTRPIDRFESQNYFANMQTLVKKLGIEQQIADIDRIRRILKKDKIILAGHSFGGFIATLYAVEFPERVKKLILLSPAEMLVMPNPEGGMFETIKRCLPEGQVKEDFDAYQMRFFQSFGGVFSKSEKDLVALNLEFVRYYVAALEAKGLPSEHVRPPEGHDSGWMPFGIYFSLGMRYDHTKSLSRITCPVLLIHGEQDIVMGLKAIKSYEDNIENAILRVLKKAAHNTFDDQPQEFADAVRAFLQGEEAGS